MNEKELEEKKRQEVLAAQQIGFSVIMALNLMFQRWKEKGWETDKVRQFSITISIEEEKSIKKRGENNDKNSLYL